MTKARQSSRGPSTAFATEMSAIRALLRHQQRRERVLRITGDEEREIQRQRLGAADGGFDLAEVGTAREDRGRHRRRVEGAQIDITEIRCCAERLDALAECRID